MKIIYFIILCYFISSCKDKTKNDIKNKVERPYLPHLSLILYKSTVIHDYNIFYKIDIIDDEVIAHTHENYKSDKNYPTKVYRDSLKYEEYLRLIELVSALNQKYDRSKNFAFGSSACKLEFNNEIYFQDGGCANWLERKEWCRKCNKLCVDDNFLPPPPEEIGLLMDYIASLSLIPITEVTFDACLQCSAFCDGSSIYTPFMLLPQSKIK